MVKFSSLQNLDVLKSITRKKCVCYVGILLPIHATAFAIAKILKNLFDVSQSRSFQVEVASCRLMLAMHEE